MGRQALDSGEEGAPLVVQVVPAGKGATDTCPTADSGAGYQPFRSWWPRTMEWSHSRW